MGNFVIGIGPGETIGLTPVTEISRDSTFQERSRNAYLQNLPAIRSLPETAFKHITIDIASAVELALSVSARARRLFEPFSGQAALLDSSLPARLESFSLALSHADVLHKAAREPTSTSADVVNSAIELREIMLADVSLSVLRGRVDRSVLSGLRGINGYSNLASDLRLIIRFFRENAQAIAGRTTVTDDELEQAESLASHLVATLAERDRAPGILVQATRDRNAAFALFVKTYEELRAAVRYLRRKQGDADLLAPTLFARRSLCRRASATTSKPLLLRSTASATR